MNKARGDPLFNRYYWKKIATALAINALTVPIVIVLFFQLGIAEEPFEKVLKVFQNNSSSFFWPWNKFFSFFRSNAIAPALIEEFFTRDPIRILIGLIELFRKEKNWWLTALAWLVGLTLNYHWAIGHTTHNLVWISIFVAGLPWLWLVIRTNRLWPAMFCHTAANLTIYFLIKTYNLVV